MLYHQPIFIVAAPRSGSTLLFETLARNRAFCTLGGESHRQIESIAALRPASKKHASNLLSAEDATPAIAQQIRRNFNQSLTSSDGRQVDCSAGIASGARIRLLEKTPKNALRIGFFKQIFPDCRFIYLYRQPEGNIARRHMYN